MTDMLLAWAASASALIVVVLLLRWVAGRRISAGLRYGIWAVVLIRLLVPGSLALSVTIPRLPSWEPPESFREERVYVLPVDSAPIGESSVSVRADGAITEFDRSRPENGGEKMARYADRVSSLELLMWIWAAGAAGMGFLLIISNLHFSRRLHRVRRPLEGISSPIPVYAASALPSPCLVGLLNPAIYITEEASGNPAMLRHVLAHELTHYNHRDHLWSVLRGAALAVHWWNPLVWLAAVYSRRDGELACDEGALKRLGDGERAAYGETLLALVTSKAQPADLLRFSTTMSGGKRSLKERMQRIAHRPRHLVSVMAAVVIVLSLSVLAAFGRAKAADTPDDTGRPAPETRTNRPDDAWRTAKITLDEDGVPYIDYQYGDTTEFLNGEPIPAPRAWADDDLAGRNSAKYLEGSPDVWAKLVSPADGWLAACYGREGAAADTYVYKTGDGGMTWTEVAMPGTGGRIADVGFLSPDRLIVAQQLFGGAPCFITKDGGESWEEIELPDGQVLEIGFFAYADAVYMDVGAHGSDPNAVSMISYDMGDTWTSELAGYRKSTHVDLDHDGRMDVLAQRKVTDAGLTLWNLQFIPFSMSSPVWTGEAGSPHVGWTSVYLCRLGGEDYLLEYTPWMGGGSCEYRYKLFYLTASGEEVAVQENSVEFDLIFDPEYAEQHQYDPWAINAFMEEINALLASSEELVNTDENLLGTFQAEGRLYDSLWWLEEVQDENLSLLDNLLNYGSYAQDHPDDVWSPLADLLLDLTEKDIAELDMDVSKLVPYLKTAERGSRFYTWDSYAEAFDSHGAEPYSSAQRDIALTDGSTLHLIASSKNSGNVLMILEMPEETVSAFYISPELNRTIQEWLAVRSMQTALAALQPEDIHGYHWNIFVDQTALADALHRAAGHLVCSGGEEESPQYLIYFTCPNKPTRPIDVAELAAMETEGLVRITCQCSAVTSHQLTGYVNDMELYQLVRRRGKSAEAFPWDVYRAEGFTLMLPSPKMFLAAVPETGVWQVFSEDDPRVKIEIYFSSLLPQQVYENPELLFEEAKDIEDKAMGQGSGYSCAFCFTGSAGGYDYHQNVYVTGRGDGSLIYTERLPDDIDEAAQQRIMHTSWIFRKINIWEHE